MKKPLFFIFLTLLILETHAQSAYVMGTVTTEDGTRIPNVTIYNVQTDEKVDSNHNGDFFIRAKEFDQLRFVKKGYERVTQKLSKQDFQDPLAVVLMRLPEEIEEVKIAFTPTGKLDKDVQHVGDIKIVKELKSDMADYIQAPSTAEVLAPKPGEFVQPVGPGISIGAVKPKWDDVDFMNFLIQNLGDDFFIRELGLQKSEIQTFIYYVFRNFNRKVILFYGFCSPADLARFDVVASQKITAYRQNLPNDPPSKKKKRKK